MHHRKLFWRQCRRLGLLLEVPTGLHWARWFMPRTEIQIWRGRLYLAYLLAFYYVRDALLDTGVYFRWALWLWFVHTYFDQPKTPPVGGPRRPVNKQCRQSLHSAWSAQARRVPHVDCANHWH